MLAEAETEELNFIVLNINCSALAEVVSRPTMDMLTGSDQRLPELHVLARSDLHAIYSLDHITLIGVSVYTEVEQDFFSLKSRHRPSATCNDGRISLSAVELSCHMSDSCVAYDGQSLTNSVHVTNSVHAYNHDVFTVLCGSCSPKCCTKLPCNIACNGST